MGLHACGEESIPAEAFAGKAVIVRTAGGEPDSIIALAEAGGNAIRSFMEVGGKIILACHMGLLGQAGRTAPEGGGAALHATLHFHQCDEAGDDTCLDPNGLG